MGREDTMSMVSEKPSERSRWPPLTRMLMSGEMSSAPMKEFTAKEKFDRWMVNEGYRRLYAQHEKICYSMR